MIETVVAVVEWIQSNSGMVGAGKFSSAFVVNASEGTVVPYLVLEPQPSGLTDRDSEVNLEADTIELQSFATTALEAMQLLEELENVLQKKYEFIPITDGHLVSVERGDRNVIPEGKHIFRAFTQWTFTTQRTRPEL